MTHDEKIVEAASRAYCKVIGLAYDDLSPVLAAKRDEAMRAAITAYQAEAWQGEEAEYEVWQNDMPIASASGPRERALFEAMHYANVYRQDGPVTVMQVIRQTVLFPAPNPPASP